MLHHAYFKLAASQSEVNCVTKMRAKVRNASLLEEAAEAGRAETPPWWLTGSNLTGFRMNKEARLLVCLGTCLQRGEK